MGVYLIVIIAPCYSCCGFVYLSWFLIVDLPYFERTHKEYLYVLNLYYLLPVQMVIQFYSIQIKGDTFWQLPVSYITFFRFRLGSLFVVQFPIWPQVFLHQSRASVCLMFGVLDRPRQSTHSWVYFWHVTGCKWWPSHCGVYKDKLLCLLIYLSAQTRDFVVCFFFPDFWHLLLNIMLK